MDEMTQQNSALVEENAATAKTLEHQAIAMDERVAFFCFDDDSAVEGTPTPVNPAAPAKHGVFVGSKSSMKPFNLAAAPGARSGLSPHAEQSSTTGENVNLDGAIEKHAEWKVRLRSAISNQERLDTPTISKDNCCQLGQWLYGHGKSKFGTKPEFRSLVALHKAFHVEAGRVSELINERKYGEAERALSNGTTYVDASISARNAIVALKKVVAA